jgi:hypothetical protein
MSSLNNIGKKARDSNTYCSPRHITTSLQKWALITKQKFASPLDFDPNYQAYWSEITRDTVFGASTNAFDTKFTGFSFCHPNYCDYLLHSLVGHALQSANSTQEATATFLLLPDWLGWIENGYMAWINDYPEQACVLAKFSAASMLLNPTEVWLDAPPQPQHNKNKMKLIVVWNNQGKQALNESNPAWLKNLKQAIPEATWTCNNSAHVLGTARVKCKNKQRKRFQLLHPDTPIAANISHWQVLHNTNANQYKSPHIPKVQIWKSITYTDGSAMQDAISKQQSIGAGIFTPTTDAGYSDTVTINPGGSGPTLTINRAKLAAVLIAVQKGHTEIATDIIPLTD